MSNTAPAGHFALPWGRVAERGAPRSESKINMIASGNHSLIHSEVG